MSDITSHPSTIGIRKCIKSQLEAMHLTKRYETKKIFLQLKLFKFGFIIQWYKELKEC